MACENEWTFQFPDVRGENGPFEIRPLTFNYKDNRSEYAFARAKFPAHVRKHMGYETRYDQDGKLRRKELVYLLHNGEIITSLYVKPDFISYGANYTHIEFHDVQESMDSGVLDKQWETVSLREAYNYVFDHYTGDLIQEIEFTDNIPDELATQLYGQQFVNEIEMTGGHMGTVNARNEVQEIEQDLSKRLLDSKYAVNFDRVSPARALLILNQKFNIQTWVNRRTLLVGFPEATARIHIAAPDDNRVWRYSPEEVNIRHPREPIRQVSVEGGWVDEPGLGGIEDMTDEVTSWFGSDGEGGVADFIAHGVAYRTDIDYGETLVVKNTEAKRDALPGIAEATMREQTKDGHSGAVEINTDLSGDFTRLERVEPGDLIHMVPDDDFFENPTATSGQVGDEPEDIDPCRSFVNNELYFVKEIQHDLDDSGYWSVTLDVAMYPDVLDGNVESIMRYHDPASGEWMDEEDVYDGNWIENEADFFSDFGAGG